MMFHEAWIYFTENREVGTDIDGKGVAGGGGVYLPEGLCVQSPIQQALFSSGAVIMICRQFNSFQVELF
jgi:hypothetical protein